MTDTHQGACLCGAVRFTTHGPLRGVVYCHCSQCRKQTGHHYAATNVADKDIEIRGTSAVTWYRASEKARRGFCRICGSALFWKHDELDVISVMAGAFEKPTGLTAEAHIFVADKGDYYDIDDGLPQFERSAPTVKTRD
ncbi:MAG: GFA family protein [Rhizobiaceae bacterium]|nr:MAG: GFA family protein [Rhizobiaceae bacterium]